jgi:GTP-binding protein
MSSPLRQARFISSAFEISQLVPDEGVEIAFAGRSNAGKSTAVNRLTSQKNLCKTSKTPGRTQLINFFAVDDEHRLVDLPGYGYAKVPIKMRNHWNEVLSRYLKERKSLNGLVIVVDIRRGLSDMDWGLINLVDNQLPIHILLTKADKLKRGAQQKVLLGCRKELSQYDITASCFSASSGEGLDEFQACCHSLLQLDL